MFDLGGGELLMILVAVLVLFGPKKLPELAQGLGKGLRQFKRAQQDFTEQINSAFAEEQRKEGASRANPGAANTIARPLGQANRTEPAMNSGKGSSEASAEGRAEPRSGNTEDGASSAASASGSSEGEDKS